MNTSEVIPRIIWQTWHTKDLPLKMSETVQNLRQQHPEFKHYLFDIPMCRNFIRKYFRPEVLDAYDSLIPYAFKSDLWRLCVLYIHGGIYLDMRFKCVDDFRLTELLSSEHYSPAHIKNGISNGLMVCMPKKTIILNIIKEYTYRIKNKKLNIVGPTILGELLKPHITCTLERRNEIGYYYNNRYIITAYNMYKQDAKRLHWRDLLNKNIVYNNNLFKDFIEIGTSDFNTEIQKADDTITGLSIEPISYYLNKLPNKPYVKKLNIAISDTNGVCKFFYIPKNDIKKYNLPEWVRGCNSINSYHPTVLKLLKDRNIEPRHIIKSYNIQKKTFMQLIKEKNINGIYFLKIDTEGHDCVILNKFMNDIQNNHLLPHKIVFKTNILTPKDNISKTIEVIKSKGYDLISSNSNTILLLNLNKLQNKTKFTNGLNNYYITKYPTDYNSNSLPYENTLESAMEYCIKNNYSGVTYQNNNYEVRAGKYLMPHNKIKGLVSWVYI
jgi:FkbM family methyltransferase